jgi:osmotically-inducible protein OsmY
MRNRYDRDNDTEDRFDSGWRRDDHNGGRNERPRYEEDRNRYRRSEGWAGGQTEGSQRNFKPWRDHNDNYAPERSYVDQGDYWDEEQQEDWGVRSSEDRFGRQRYPGARLGEPSQQQRGYGSQGRGSPQRSPGYPNRQATFGWGYESGRTPPTLPGDLTGAHHGWSPQRREWERTSANNRWDEQRFDNAGFAGKGPKGYVRSDERIREDICDRLSDDDEVDASDITVSVKEGIVTLEGTVPDRRTKHRAEDIADSTSGVRDVSNSLRARKGLIQEFSDKLSGDAEREHQGHAGSGTRNSPNAGSTLGNGTRGL